MEIGLNKSLVHWVYLRNRVYIWKTRDQTISLRSQEVLQVRKICSVLCVSNLFFATQLVFFSSIRPPWFYTVVLISCRRILWNGGFHFQMISFFFLDLIEKGWLFHVQPFFRVPRNLFSFLYFHMTSATMALHLTSKSFFG